ncbi:hypothetical protein D3C76_1045200 [compost metagenome]
MADPVHHITEALAQGGHGNLQRFQQQAEQGAQGEGRQMPRHLGHQARPDHQHCQAGGGHQGIAQVRRGQRPGQQAQLLHIVLWRFGQLQAEQVLDLQGGDDDADAGGETQGDRIGDELDQPAEARQAHGDQDHPGHQGAQQQSAHAELLGDGQQYHHEGSRGAADVEARAAGEGDQRCRHQHGVQAVLRRHTYGNGQRHGQGDGDDADREPGGQVAAQGGNGVTLAQGLAQGRKERREISGHGHSFGRGPEYRSWRRVGGAT